MAGRRRVQRSVRVTVGAALVAVAAGVVLAAVTTSTAVGAAALLAVVAGAAAARVMYAEVVQTRRDTSRSRADQALAFSTALSGLRAQHAEQVAGLTLSVSERDRSIGDLRARIRAAEKQAETQQLRAEQQARRAVEAQTRLASVLDAVLAGPGHEVDLDQPHHSWSDDTVLERRELPTVVDMLAWEERASGGRADRARRRA